MEIDIELFKKNFEVNLNENSLTNKQGIYTKILPFSSNTNANYIVSSFENVLSGYITYICGTRKINLSKDDLINKACSEVKHTEQSKYFLEQTLSEIFFNEDDSLIPLNISLHKYLSCSSMESKISEFIADIMGHEKEIYNIINNIENNYNYNIIENFFINNIEDSLVKNNRVKNQYKPLLFYMQKTFLKDIEFLINNKDFKNEYFIDLLELYYFNYVSQVSLNLNKFFKADPFEPNKLYYALDWEKMSKTRLASKSWFNLNININTLFSHAIVFEILNQNKHNNFSSYYTISKDLKNNISKDEKYSAQIKQISDIYKSCLKDYEDHLNNIKKDKDYFETKTEMELCYLFECVYAQFKFSSKKRSNDAYAKQFIEFCKNKKIKNRGSLGFVLNITQKDLIFLTKLSVGENETKRLTDVFFEFEKRGVYLDKSSKDEIIKYYEKLNIIEKKSDSGDALYVKRIL